MCSVPSSGSRPFPSAHSRYPDTRTWKLSAMILNHTFPLVLFLFTATLMIDGNHRCLSRSFMVTNTKSLLFVSTGCYTFELLGGHSTEMGIKCMITLRPVAEGQDGSLIAVRITYIRGQPNTTTSLDFNRICFVIQSVVSDSKG
jgi:hypothetical protein